MHLRFDSGTKSSGAHNRPAVDSEEADHGVEFDTYDVGNDKTRVDVMIDSENIVVESNSLKAVRFIARKFMDNGYLISRDKQVEKIFRKNKESI